MKKIVFTSLSVFGLLGVLKIFSIAPFNRMAADDFSSAVVARSGIWEAFLFTYKNWMGRFTSILVESITVSMLGDSGKIMTYSFSIIFFILFSFLVFYKRFFRTTYKNLTPYILTAVSVSALYQLTPNKSESWYWLTGSLTYLLPLILSVLAVSFYFLPKLKKRDYVLNFVLVFLSVGCNETAGLLILVFFILYVVYDFMNKNVNKLTLNSALASTFSFSIVFFAPGNMVRKGSSGSDPMNIVGSVFYSMKEGPNALFQMLWDNLYFLLPLTIIFIYIFAGSKITKIDKYETVDIILKKLFMIILVGIALSVIYMLPAYINLGRVQPDRSAINLSLILLLFVIYAAYLLSRIVSVLKWEDNLIYKFTVFVFAVIALISSGVFTQTLASDIYTAKDYSRAYDKMIINLINVAQLDNTDQETEVSLPDSGLIAEILDPPGKYTYKNLSLSQFFNIGKVVSVEYDYGY